MDLGSAVYVCLSVYIVPCHKDVICVVVVGVYVVVLWTLRTMSRDQYVIGWGSLLIKVGEIKDGVRVDKKFLFSSVVFRLISGNTMVCMC